jgi:hypothetical protein
MWETSHLVDLSGASFVTTAAQKSKSEANRHNVAHAFSKRSGGARQWGADTQGVDGR